MSLYFYLRQQVAHPYRDVDMLFYSMLLEAYPNPVQNKMSYPYYPLKYLY